jgi:hypothetical protein
MEKKRREERRALSAAIRKKLPRVIINFATLLVILIVGYITLPIINYAYGMQIPGVGISVGLVISVIILAVVVLLAIRILSDLTSLFGLSANLLTRLVPGLTSEHMSDLKRISFNLLYVMLVVVVFWIVAPFIPLIPGVGQAIATALPLVIVAIVVLLFWDIGRTIYRHIEVFSRKLADSISTSIEQSEKPSNE